MHVSFSSSMSLWNLFEYTRPVYPALLCANWAPLIAVVSIPFSPWIVVQQAGRNRTKPRSIKHIFFLTIIRFNRFTIYSSIVLKILRLLLRIKRARRNRKKKKLIRFHGSYYKIDGDTGVIILRQSADWEPLFCGESKIHGGCLFESCVSFKNRTFEATNFHPRIYDPCAAANRETFDCQSRKYIYTV